MTRQMPNGKNARKFTAGRDRRTFLDPFLVGAVRRRATWFKAPDVSDKLRATRLDPAQRHALRARHLGDLAAKPFTMADEADLLLNKPTHTGDRRTSRFAGKAYHWRQSYDGVLRLAPGASPW